MAQLSKNFADSEFHCSKHGKLHAPVHPKQIQLLQRIRDKVGKPLIVTSGSRCPEFQASLKAADLSDRVAANSPHVPRMADDGKMYSFATDIACFLGLDNKDPMVRQKMTRDLVRSVDPQCRIGWRAYAGHSFVHIDVAYLVSRDYIKGLTIPAASRQKLLSGWTRAVEW